MSGAHSSSWSLPRRKCIRNRQYMRHHRTSRDTHIAHCKSWANETKLRCIQRTETCFWEETRFNFIVYLPDKLFNIVYGGPVPVVVGHDFSSTQFNVQRGKGTLFTVSMDGYTSIKRTTIVTTTDKRWKKNLLKRSRLWDIFIVVLMPPSNRGQQRT